MRARLSNYRHGGVKTEVDGVELPEVTYISLSCPVGEPPRLTVSMNATDGLEIELDASVEITMNHLIEDHVEVEQVSPTKQTLRVIARG